MLYKVKRNNEKGFTLIELMIVIAIIGILAAIAIPQFSSYRKRSFDAAAKSDLRNLATAMEAYYTDHPATGYTDDINDLVGDTYGFYTSDNVTAEVSSANSTTYVIKAWHNGSDNSFVLRGPGGDISQISH